jgi:hypothetical protein
LAAFCVRHRALVFVRLAHDRRFVGFLFRVVFIKISGRHRVKPMITKVLLSVIQVEKIPRYPGVNRRYATAILPT